MTAPSQDRLIGSLEAILAALLPKLAFYIRWEARVVAAVPGPPVLITCAPTSPDGIALLGPTLANVTLWPGPSGAYAIPSPGSLVRIGFADGSPSKPEIVALDPSSTPILTTLGGGTDPIALSALVSAELLKIATALTTHVHSGVTSGGAVSGPAAPLYTPGSVASLKVVSG